VNSLGLDLGRYVEVIMWMGGWMVEGGRRILGGGFEVVRREMV
jgi:hypothetical protein